MEVGCIWWSGVEVVCGSGVYLGGVEWKKCVEVGCIGEVEWK